MSAFLVSLLVALIKALGQDIESGVLQALKDARARADEIALGQQQQKAADQAQETANANANAQTVAATVAAENAASAAAIANPGSLRDASPDSRD